jgi:xanthine/CO dehydrogenase XdhC/CoxF family maturation factor
MKEIREIISAFDECVAAGRKAALASVVHLDGSSYRRPGARMLVDDEGRLTGAISGGCLEGDALRRALLVINQQYPKLVTYDTTDEEDITLGVQLGCAGVIQVLFEPVDPSFENNPIDLLREVITKRGRAVMVTLFDLKNKLQGQVGTCMLMEEDGTITGQVPVESIREGLMKDMQEAMRNTKSAFVQYEIDDNTWTAFIEYIEPPVCVVVVGAGNDAIPMVQMADIIGWETRVVDGRSTHARPERFIAACQVLVSKPELVLEQIPIDEKTVFVLMTHNYNYDMAMLRALLERRVTYIGALGPKKKLDRMLGELREKGFVPDRRQLASIYGPVGLEIGAETAEEIALSIISEIKAVLSGKSGGSLREKTDVIHSRAGLQIMNRKSGL